MTTGPLLRQVLADGCVQEECLDRIHELLAELWLAEAGIAQADRVSFETAVTEVAGNIVRHRRVHSEFDCCLTVNVYSTVLEAVFHDTADEVDADVVSKNSGRWPDEMADHGRGLGIARAVVDELTYQRIDGLNQWRICRVRTG